MRTRILTYIGYVLLLSGCSSMYIPSLKSIPLLEMKGETQVEIAASTNSLHLASNYAFSNKYALMFGGNLSYGNFSNYYDIFTRKDEYPVSEWDLTEYGEFSHKYGEVGVGRYNILQKGLKLEVFSGFGMGRSTDSDDGSIVETLNFSSDYYQIFVQPNIGKTIGLFTWGASLRLASSYFDYTYQVDPASSYPNDNGGLPQNVTFNMFHLEPMGMISIGNENIKFVSKLGFSISEPTKSLGGLDLKKGVSNGRVNTTGLCFSIGLNIKIK